MSSRNSRASAMSDFRGFDASFKTNEVVVFFRFLKISLDEFGIVFILPCLQHIRQCLLVAVNNTPFMLIDRICNSPFSSAKKGRPAYDGCFFQNERFKAFLHGQAAGSKTAVPRTDNDNVIFSVPFLRSRSKGVGLGSCCKRRDNAGF